MPAAAVGSRRRRPAGSRDAVVGAVAARAEAAWSVPASGSVFDRAHGFDQAGADRIGAEARRRHARVAASAARTSAGVGAGFGLRASAPRRAAAWGAAAEVPQKRQTPACDDGEEGRRAAIGRRDVGLGDRLPADASGAAASVPSTGPK